MWWGVFLAGTLLPLCGKRPRLRLETGIEDTTPGMLCSWLRGGGRGACATKVSGVASKPSSDTTDGLRSFTLTNLYSEGAAVWSPTVEGGNCGCNGSCGGIDASTGHDT